MTSSTLRWEAGRAARQASPPRRVRCLVHRSNLKSSILLLGALYLAGASVAMASAPDHGWLDGEPGQILRLRGMTFVASEGSANEIVLRAQRAQFYPDHDVADLERVDVEVAPGSGRVGFEMKCDRGRLNLSSQDFVAEGNVVGTIQGGRKFEALWVAYNEKDGILYTDEPVLITDDDGSYRGGGFRYFVHQQRFRLMGGASIVQEP